MERAYTSTVSIIIQAVFIAAYIALALWMCLSAGRRFRAETGHHPPWNLEGFSTSQRVFGALSALGACVKPFGGHATALDTQVSSLSAAAGENLEEVML